MATKIKLVIVIWKDIQSSAEWIGELKEIPKEITPILCVTVGWIVRKDKDMIVVADSYTKDGTYGGATAIPRSVIMDVLDIDDRHPKAFLKGRKKNG